MCNKCSKKECKCKSYFPDEDILLFQDYYFVLFIRYVGLFGGVDEKEGGVWCRATEGPISDLNRIDI